MGESGRENRPPPLPRPLVPSMNGTPAAIWSPWGVGNEVRRGAWGGESRGRPLTLALKRAAYCASFAKTTTTPGAAKLKGNGADVFVRMCQSQVLGSRHVNGQLEGNYRPTLVVHVQVFMGGW